MTTMFELQTLCVCSWNTNSRNVPKQKQTDLFSQDIAIGSVNTRCTELIVEIRCVPKQKQTDLFSQDIAIRSVNTRCTELIVEIRWEKLM